MSRSKKAAGPGRGGPPPASDPEQGQWQGKSIARRFVSEDGLTVLVGKTARDNDLLTFKIGTNRDFWLHIASGPGSHVVVRNPENLTRLPKATQQLAASLAVRHSKGKAGGRTAVHLTTCSEVRKPKGFPAGKVTLGRYSTVHAEPHGD
ncbi:MAG: NFACT RNA binding domain-containing protein [Acidobacteriota bacterium]